MAESNANDHENVRQGADDNDRPTKTVTMDEPLVGPSENVAVTEMLDYLESTLPALEDEPAAETLNVVDEASQPVDKCDPTVEDYVAGLIARTASAQGSQMEVKPAVGLIASKPTQPPKRKAPQAPRQPVPPEGREVITNLRDLANMNTRSVLDAHSSHRLILEMHNKLAVALVSIVISFALTSFAASGGTATLLAAVAALIAAMVWTIKYFALARRLSKAFRQTDKPVAPD